jgi:hypothetical protein
MRFLSLTVWAVCVAAIACSPPADSTAANPLDAPPVDRARVRSVDEAASWPHRRTFEADLNGDGTSERVVLTSDVQLGDNGKPLWEDGHRWAVFVEDQGRRTLLYAAFVPNGHAEAAVLTPDTDGRRHVLIQERTPQQARSLVVAYERPSMARAVSTAHYQIEQWLPGLTSP